MSKTVAISELKAHCLRFVDEVARRRSVLVVTKRGKPIARVVPLDEAPGAVNSWARLGTLTGLLLEPTIARKRPSRFGGRSPTTIVLRGLRTQRQIGCATSYGIRIVGTVARCVHGVSGGRAGGTRIARSLRAERVLVAKTRIEAGVAVYVVDSILRPEPHQIRLPDSSTFPAPKLCEDGEVAAEPAALSSRSPGTRDSGASLGEEQSS